MSNKFYVVPLMAFLDAVHTDGIAVCRVAGVTSVKIVHWIAGVTGNLVQALTSAYSFFNGILIVHYFIIFHCDIDTGCKKQSTKSIVENLIAF